MPYPSTIPAKSRAVLREMAAGRVRVLVGTLGERPLRPNRRIFRRDDGTELNQGIVVYLLRAAFIKILSVDGPRNYMTITELGRAVVESNSAGLPA